jgi:hypothetical protein
LRWPEVEPPRSRFSNVQVSGGCTISGKITTSPKLSIASGD